MAKKNICNYCFAYYHGVSCIAQPETRKKLCEAAMNRMNKNACKEVVSSLKEYIKYIPKRISFLKAFNGDIQSNEYKYYCGLQDYIKEWGKKHIIFYSYLYGKIKVEQVKNMLGVSERTFYRTLKQQSEQLFKLIEKQEIILSTKYPFIPMTDIFMEK